MFAANKVDDVESGNKLLEKYKKLLKTKKLSKGLKLFKSKNWKIEKLSKSQKLAKLRKTLSKSRNLPNLDIKKNGLSFLTPILRWFLIIYD